MFVGYAEQESDSVHMWDPSTMRIVVTHDVIWLEKLYFQPDDMAGVLELDTEEGLDNKSESDTAMTPFKSVKMGGNITWSDPVMTELTSDTVTRLDWKIKPPDRLTYTPAIELRYLGEMAGLDHKEIRVVRMSIRRMEFTMVGGGWSRR